MLRWSAAWRRGTRSAAAAKSGRVTELAATRPDGADELFPMRRLAAGDSAGRVRQAQQEVELVAGGEEAEDGDDGVGAVDGAAVAPAHVRAGVSNYEGTARLKITTPTRPAFLPPPPLPHLRTSPRPTRWLGSSCKA